MWRKVKTESTGQKRTYIAPSKEEIWEYWKQQLKLGLVPVSWETPTGRAWKMMRIEYCEQDGWYRFNGERFPRYKPRFE